MAARRTFRKADHLLSTREFKAVFQGGRRGRAGGLTVFVRENGLDRARLGLSVGKRFARQSVNRMRMKRLLREAFRLNRDDLPTADIVVVPQPGTGPGGLSAAARALIDAVKHARERKR